ncbi:DNA repair protein RAD50-like isoform X2 [Montipora foliosa]|uniref:DNA repair protein RAD50-like isoform X1 n=1 Tax=Montipora foliosa TaxID=591990 RepID=UPI0035F1F187
MSSLEKMKIQGIRSYSHSEPSIIEFQKPLTLIVGPNGAGKTSVIECLNYMATGDMPPGSKGNLFVHDPKIAGELEVKGQIKLRFRDVTGNTIVVTRTLVSEQKGKKLQTRTMEGNIMREVHGERRSLSSKCADINREMISFLGVSKAVLDNVIFCHQEESNWPLSEGKVLKQKFDDIFAATRYIKALEAIRKFRQEQAQTVKEYAIDLSHLKANKEKADQIADELAQTQGKVAATEDKVKELNEKIKPTELRLAELACIADDVFELEKKVESLSTERRQLLKVEADLKEKIINLFNGPVEELHKIYSDFTKRVVEKENTLRDDECIIHKLGEDQQKLTAEENQLHVEGGRLEQQAHRHKQNVSDRDNAVIDLATKHNFKGYEKGPFSKDSVDQFLEEMKRKYQNIIEDTKRKREVFEKKSNELQKKIDDMKKNQAQCEETIRLKKNFMRENQQKLRQIGLDLKSVDASANSLKTLEGDLQRAERELKMAHDSGNVSELGREIGELQSEKRQVDNGLRQLREEQQAMHMQSKTQAELDMMTKEKSNKEEAIQQIMERHEEDLKTTLGTRGTTESLHTRLKEHLKEKERELKETTKNLQKLKEQLSSKQTRKRMIVDSLTDKENRVQEHKRQISEACGENDYNTTKELIKNNIDSLQDERGIIGSLEKIYSKFVSKLESSDVHSSGCPLCHRTFNNNREIDELATELRNKIRTLPDRRVANERSLNQEQNRYDHILQLAPAKETLESLENKEIPDIKSKLDEIKAEEQRIQDEITELEDVLSITESEEQSARQMEPDIRMLDKYKAELREIDRRISLLQSKLHGVVPGRTMQSISSEITERQDKSDTLNTNIDRKRTQLSRLQQQLSELETNVHDLKSKKLQLEAQLQTRTRLEQQKADLTANNSAFAREIEEAEADLQPLATGLEELRVQQQDVKRQKEAADEENRKLLEKIRTSGDKVHEKNAEIRRYMNQGCDTALKENEARLRELAGRTEKLRSEKEAVSTEIDKLKEDIAKQQIRARELEDNIQLKSIQEETQNIDKRIADVKEELKKFGEHQDLVSERQELQTQSDELRKDIAHYEGRLRGYEDDARRCQRELRSDLYKNAEKRHREQFIAIKTTEMANADLEKYYKALDRAIMRYHGLKMAEINKIIKEYWINTYKGNDIDTIEIRSDEEEGSGATKARRTYNYRVVMIKGDTALDMRGRCSAGQKVLASLIIRLALAETFCLNCGILTLDEPTTNLDEDNIESLANQLASIIRTRQQQRNFQLVVITHDEEFVQNLGRADFVDYYFRIYKDDSGYSKILRQSVAALNREESLME